LRVFPLFLFIDGILSLIVLHDDFPISVNKAALEAQEENRRRKKTELPLMDDIIKLRNYLDEKRMCTILKEIFSMTNR